MEYEKNGGFEARLHDMERTSALMMPCCGGGVSRLVDSVTQGRSKGTYTVVRHTQGLGKMINTDILGAPLMFKVVSGMACFCVRSSVGIWKTVLVWSPLVVVDRRCFAAAHHGVRDGQGSSKAGELAR